MVLNGTGRYGWQCPICKRIYAPFMNECRWCNVKEERVDVLENEAKKISKDRYKIKLDMPY